MPPVQKQLKFAPEADGTRLTACTTSYGENIDWTGELLFQHTQRMPRETATCTRVQGTT